MAANRKLSEDHRRGIAYLCALGQGPSAISQELASGLEIPGQGSLSAVVVTEATVRYQLARESVKQQLSAWRRELFGDIYAAPLAYAGERLVELVEINHKLDAQLVQLEPASNQPRDKDNGKARRAEVRIVLAHKQSVLRDVEQLVQRATPDIKATATRAGGAGAGLIEVTASGKLTEEALAALAQDLRAAQLAGIIDLEAEPATAAQPT